MPLPLIPLVLGGGALANMVGKGSQIAVLIGIAAKLYMFYVLVSAFVAGFFLACAIFAKDIAAWYIDFIMSIVGMALDFAGLAGYIDQFLQMLYSMPPLALQIIQRVHAFDNFHLILTAIFLNMALRSLPLVGGFFK